MLALDVRLPFKDVASVNISIDSAANELLYWLAVHFKWDTDRETERQRDRENATQNEDAIFKMKSSQDFLSIAGNVSVSFGCVCVCVFFFSIFFLSFGSSWWPFLAEDSGIWIVLLHFHYDGIVWASWRHWLVPTLTCCIFFFFFLFSGRLSVSKWDISIFFTRAWYGKLRESLSRIFGLKE